MTFAKLSSYFSKLEGTASRNAMTAILAHLFSETKVSEIDLVCYLALGRLTPLYEPLEFQLAEKMVVRVLAQTFEVEEEKVKQEYKRVGDLGEVARALRARNSKFPFDKAKGKQIRNSKLTVTEVYRRLRKIAEESGEGSQQRKVDGLAAILHDLDPVACKYLVRMVLGRLRLGFSDVTILDSLSWMKVGDKGLRPDIERAYFVRADIGEIAKRFKARGLEGLMGISAQLGVPVMPALCQRLKSADEMIKKMGTVAVEPKYDGQRVQIHFSKTKENKTKKNRGFFLRAFTRNLEEVSFMFPELSRIGEQIQAREAILDSEAVGYNPTTGEILPFQQLITRKRKHAIHEAAKQVPLRFFVFDVLYKNGKSLLDVALSKRVEILDAVVVGTKVLAKAQRIVTDDPEKLRSFHNEQLKANLEGAVVKKWDDPYIPGRRGWSWVKFKEAEEKAAGLADTLDCVVMGYYRGRGKRAAFGIGGFLVGVRREDKFYSVSKIGTGLSDEQWKEIKSRIKNQESRIKPKSYAEVNKSLIPDVWVEPSLVVEIAADNITKSPVHAAGLALRFPRLVRFRDDKNPGQATTVRELRRLYRLQSH